MLVWRVTSVHGRMGIGGVLGGNEHPSGRVCIYRDERIRIFSVFLLFACAICAMSCRVAYGATNPVRVIFTADIKGNYESAGSNAAGTYGGLPYIHTKVQELVDDAKVKNIPVLILDSGSMRGIGLSDVLGGGKLGGDFFENVGYHVVCVGQNDLLLGMPSYLSVVKGRPFEVVGSNMDIRIHDSVSEKDTGVVRNANITVTEANAVIKKWVVINCVVPGSSSSSVPSVKVGVISIIDDSLCQFTSCQQGGIKIFDVNGQKPEVVEEHIKSMQTVHPDVQFVIVVNSWQEKDYFDLRNSQFMKGDVFIYGYDPFSIEDIPSSRSSSAPTFGTAARPHPLYGEKPETGTGIIIGAVPGEGSAVGVLDLEVDDAKEFGKRVSINIGGNSKVFGVVQCPSANAGPTGCVQPNPMSEASQASQKALNSAKASKVVGNLFQSLLGSVRQCRFEVCGVGALAAESIRQEGARLNSPCDIAVVNAGAIRSSMTAGPVTFQDILTVFPFNDNLKRVTLDYAAVLEMFENSISTLPTVYDEEGVADSIELGGTGKYLQVAGAHVYFDRSKPPGSRVHTIYIEPPGIANSSLSGFGARGWRKAERGKKFTVCVSSFITAGGDGYKIGEKAENISGFSASLQDTIIASFNESVSSSRTLSGMHRTVETINGSLTVTEDNYRVTSVTQSSMCPQGCSNGVCLWNSTCECTTFSYTGVACSSPTVQDLDLCSSIEDIAKSIARRFSVAWDVNPSGLVVFVSTGVTFIFASLLMTCRVWFLDLKMWTLSSRLPLIEGESKAFWKFFTLYEVNKTTPNIFALFTVLMESLQVISFPFWANVDWDWTSHFRLIVSLTSGTIEELWFFWVTVFIVTLWLTYALVLYFEVDVSLESTKLGHYFMKPCTMFLLLVNSAGYIPACTLMLSATNCQVVSQNIYNSTYLTSQNEALSLINSFDSSLAPQSISHLQQLQLIYHESSEYATFRVDSMYVVPLCLECFTPKHWVMMAVSVVCLLLFIPLSLYTSYMWQEFHDKASLQIRWNPKFLLLLLLVKTLMVINRVYFALVAVSYSMILFVLMAFTSSILLVYKPCNLIPLNYWASIGYCISSVLCLVTAIMSIKSENDGELVTFIVSSLAIFGVLFGALICYIKFPIVLNTTEQGRSGKAILKSLMYATKTKSGIHAESSITAYDSRDSPSALKATNPENEWFYALFEGGAEQKVSETFVKEEEEDAMVSDALLNLDAFDSGFSHASSKSSKVSAMTEGPLRQSRAYQRRSSKSLALASSKTLQIVGKKYYLDNNEHPLEENEHDMKQMPIHVLDCRRNKGKSIASRSEVETSLAKQSQIERDEAEKGNEVAWREINIALDECLEVLEDKIVRLRKKEPENGEAVKEFYSLLYMLIFGMRSAHPSLLLSHYLAVRLIVTESPENEKIRKRVEVKVLEEMRASTNRGCAESKRKQKTAGGDMEHLAVQEALEKSILRRARSRFKFAVLEFCENCVSPQLDRDAVFCNHKLSNEGPTMANTSICDEKGESNLMKSNFRISISQSCGNSHFSALGNVIGKDDPSGPLGPNARVAREGKPVSKTQEKKEGDRIVSGHSVKEEEEEEAIGLSKEQSASLIPNASASELSEGTVDIEISINEYEENVLPNTIL
eukprot:Nk52_evm2s1945 gene=Nk52_evmTU2s1945